MSRWTSLALLCIDDCLGQFVDHRRVHSAAQAVDDDGVGIVGSFGVRDAELVEFDDDGGGRAGLRAQSIVEGEDVAAIDYKHRRRW